MSLSIRNRIDRGKDPRPDQRPARNGIAQRLVDRRAERLHGRDAALDRPHRILRRIQHRLLRRLFAIRFVVMRPPVLRIEVPPDVHMRIDPARHERAIAEVDRDAVKVFALRHDAHDLPALDHHRRVASYMPAPIDHPRRANDDGLGGGGWGRKGGLGGGVLIRLV